MMDTMASVASCLDGAFGRCAGSEPASTEIAMATCLETLGPPVRPSDLFADPLPVAVCGLVAETASRVACPLGLGACASYSVEVRDGDVTVHAESGGAAVDLVDAWGGRVRVDLGDGGAAAIWVAFARVAVSDGDLRDFCEKRGCAWHGRLAAYAAVLPVGARVAALGACERDDDGALRLTPVLDADMTGTRLDALGFDSLYLKNCWARLVDDGRARVQLTDLPAALRGAPPLVDAHRAADDAYAPGDAASAARSLWHSDDFDPAFES